MVQWTTSCYNIMNTASWGAAFRARWWISPQSPLHCCTASYHGSTSSQPDLWWDLWLLESVNWHRCPVSYVFSPRLHSGAQTTAALVIPNRAFSLRVTLLIGCFVLIRLQKVKCRPAATQRFEHANPEIPHFCHNTFAYFNESIRVKVKWWKLIFSQMDFSSLYAIKNIHSPLKYELKIPEKVQSNSLQFHTFKKQNCSLLIRRETISDFQCGRVVDLWLVSW